MRDDRRIAAQTTMRSKRADHYVDELEAFTTAENQFALGETARSSV
jgi:hypothetical protein